MASPPVHAESPGGDAPVASAQAPAASVPPAPALKPRGHDFLHEVEKECETSLTSCYQCRKCSNGCPIAPWMDLLPHRVIRMIEMGMKDEVLASKTIWLCADCKTCVTRCPNGVDTPRFMAGLRRRAQREGVAAAEQSVHLFMESFMDTVRKTGRVHELGMMRRYKMRTGDLFSDLRLGMDMFLKGKLRIFGSKVKGMREIRQAFDEAEHGKK